MENLLDIALEQKFLDYERLCKELKMPCKRAFFTTKVTMPDGRVISEKTHRSQSWTRNMYNLFCMGAMALNCDEAGGGAYGAGSLICKSTGAVEYPTATKTGSLIDSSNMDMLTAGKGFKAAATDDTIGILVGTDNTAESFEDFVLGALCAEGVGLNELNYSLMADPTESYDAPSKTYQAIWTRVANNNSGAQIDVEELGIVGISVHAGNYYKLLLTRDLDTIAVPDTAQLTVTYTLSVVFPA